MNKEFITFENISDNSLLFIVNNIEMGSFSQGDDGFYYYFDHVTKHNSGMTSAWFHRLIADKLDELNKPFDDELEEYFKNAPVTTIEEIDFTNYEGC